MPWHVLATVREILRISVPELGTKDSFLKIVICNRFEDGVAKRYFESELNLPDMIESIMGCTWGLNSDAWLIAAKDKYEAMFLESSLFPLCRNFTATGRARCITDFLL